MLPVKMNKGSDCKEFSFWVVSLRALCERSKRGEGGVRIFIMFCLGYACENAIFYN
jgi:hypothetical protein